MTAMEMLADEVSRVDLESIEEPTCNDAGWFGDSLVDNGRFRSWLALNSRLWNHLYETEQYDALVEEMSNPILHSMNRRILFINC